MSEFKPQTKYIPLRVRFRSANEHSQNGREQPSSSQQDARDSQSPLPDNTSISFAECHTQQVKEIIHLGNRLCANLTLDEALTHITTAVTACTGFRMLVVNLLDPNGQYLSASAFTGLSDDEQRVLREAPFPFDVIIKLMRPEFRISQSYFIAHEYANVFADNTIIVSKTVDNYKTGDWHPEDGFLIPLYSPRTQKLFGCLSFDDPENEKIPTWESVETAELFANLTSLAIDNALLFQERKAERLSLEQGLSSLHEDLEILQKSDLRLHLRSTHPQLQPIVDTINTAVEKTRNIFRGMRTSTQTVAEHSHTIQRNSESLAHATLQQEQHIHQISQSADKISTMTQTISERSTILDKAAIETEDVTTEAQVAVDRAVEGMSMVREAILQSARTMKSLSESEQEINETIVALTDLTMRMHLLALNAAIEATRAGEHGQGFAVIAQEIRNLAAHSSEAARKVGTYIHTIQKETTLASQSVEQSTQQVIMQTELVTQASVALDAISIMAERLKKLIRGICATADSQSQLSLLIVTAIAEITRIMEDVTNHTHAIQQSTNHLIAQADPLRSSTFEPQPHDR